MSVTVFLSVVIYIGNDNMRERMARMQNEKRCALVERGSERCEAGGINPATLSGEHSGVVRGLYKTLSMNDSKHLNDRETGRGGNLGLYMCACLRADTLVVLTDTDF